MLQLVHAPFQDAIAVRVNIRVVTRAALLREGCEACRDQSKSSAGLMGSNDVQRYEDKS